MTAKELIEKLQELDPETPIFFDGGDEPVPVTSIQVNKMWHLIGINPETGKKEFSYFEGATLWNE